ncbi:MAG: glycosyltransferase [Oligoflexales bacterium]|nr:glycosyltransferase [Oligoflexales bacterium]
MERKNLGLVIGELYHPRMVHVFERLSEYFNVSAFVIQRDQILKKIPGCFNTLLFKSNEQTPGYMRGLEPYLSDKDIILCINIGSFSSLQAARTAKENNIPLVCYTTDSDLSIYQNYPNIKAIQEFLADMVEMFLVPTAGVAHELAKVGVLEEKVTILPPRVDTTRFAFSQEKRMKFRKYIGLMESDRVILFYGDLERSEQPELVLKALKFQQNLNKDLFGHLKLIYLGKGSFSKELQYLSYKLGLGSQTYFLSQDPEPFLADLFCASDALVLPNCIDQDRLPLFPYQMLEAMASGVIPLVAENGAQAELLSSPELTWSDHSYESLAFLINKTLQAGNKLDSYKRIVAEKVAQIGDQSSADLIFSQIRDIVELGTRQNNEIAWEQWEGQSFQEDQSAEVLERIKILDLDRLSLTDRSRLLTIKAQALMTGKDFDQAQTCFESAIKSYGKNSRAFCGLGYLAWHSYNHEEAIGAFKKGLALSPNNHQCVLGIALVYKRLGMLEDAIYWTEKSIVMGAPGKVPLKALVQACCESNEAEYAIASLERVLDLVGDDPILMRGLGQLYLKTGHVKIGHQILDKYLPSALPIKKS